MILTVRLDDFYQLLLAYPEFQDSDTRGKIDGFQTHSLTKLPIETLVEEVKPEVIEKCEIDYRAVSINGNLIYSGQRRGILDRP